ncbi:MAG: metallophosphoesterase [Saccharofermentanales bacterium]
MIYFISDNHWGHKSVIHMQNRPFINIMDMNNSMIESWNSVVKPYDEVYYLGDLSYKMNGNTLSMILNKLNGKIYLIRGNHDKDRVINKCINRFEWIKDYYTFNYEYNDKNYKFVLFHYPIWSWDGMWRGTIHICGHTHDNSKHYFENHPGRIVNVSCEMINYKPISIIDIINIMKEKNVIHP